MQQTGVKQSWFNVGMWGHEKQNIFSGDGTRNDQGDQWKRHWTALITKRGR